MSKWSVAGLGFSEGSDDFSALPYVSQELDAIVLESDTSDPLGVVRGIVKLNHDFTAESLSELLHSEAFSVLHVATHFVFRPGTVDDSYMVLGEGEQLSLNDLRVGDFPFFGLDLITLSACETALGVRNANGREMEGFGALAQSRGAASVIATLWPVSDLSTAYLMVRFYSLRETEGATKADSLRQAQLDLLEIDLEGSAETLDFSAMGLGDVAEQIPTDKNLLRHPHFWAPFILMGDWL
jgi:CHAT domain-containing protein